MKSGITISATGSASAAPDRATLTIGTSALRPIVSEANDLVDGRVRESLNALSQHGVARSDVQTTDLSVYPENDRNGALAGYRARNLVSIPSPILPKQMRMAAQAAATPVVPGSTSIQVNLAVRFALAE